MSDLIENEQEAKHRERVAQERVLITQLALNTTLTRRNALTKLFDPRRDIDLECGYPKDITPEMYITLYRREGIARRAINVFPEECWTMDPMIVEDEKPEDTEFEKAWKDLEAKKNLYHYLERIDELSGIGEFGILLLGINDGKGLNEPVEGIDESGEKKGNQAHELIYLRTFDQSNVEIKDYETDSSNPRFGHPVMYTVTFESDVIVRGGKTNNDVHWSRIIHVADNRTVSEVFGTPRLEPLYNRIYDLRKILSGSGEMFWKGAFPGYALEVNPDISDAEIDRDTLTDEMADYFNGLQRYMALNGMNVKSLDSQVADPTGHVDNQLKAIAITLSIPVRIFFGSEEAKLASTQDSKNWHKRVTKRQTKYVSPMLIRPFVDRLIAFGILPEAEYTVEWPDLDAMTDEEKADIAVKRTEALAKYVKGQVDSLIPPEEYLKVVLEWDAETIKMVIDALDLFTAEQEEEEDEIPPSLPVPPSEEDTEILEEE